PNDTIPPRDVALSDITMTATAGVDPSSGAGTATLAWTTPTGSDFSGVVIIRDLESVAGLSLQNGRFYGVGTAISGAFVIYSGRELNPGTVYTYVDRGMAPGATYYYAIYAHDRSFFYASGNVITPGVR
ncbi:unnamed protein product, partial [marine sediment metagenome]